MVFFHLLWFQCFIFFFLSLFHDYIMDELGFKCIFSVSVSLFSIAYSCKYASCNLLITVQYLWKDTQKDTGSRKSSSLTGSFETNGAKQLCIEQLPILRNYMVGPLHIWSNFNKTIHFAGIEMMLWRNRGWGVKRKSPQISEQLYHKILI